VCSEGCGWGLYVVAGTNGCLSICGRVGVWVGDIALSGFFRRVVCWGEGSGLVMELDMGESVRSFCG